MAKRRAKGEGTVYEDEARGDWTGLITIDGKRRRVRGRTKKEVTDKLGALRFADPVVARLDRSVALATLLNEWMDKVVARRLADGEIAPATAEAHEWAVCLWVHHAGNVRLVNLTTLRAMEAMAAMSTGENRLSRASLVKIRSTLNQACRWGQRHDYLVRNPAEAIELPASKVLAPKREKAALSAADRKKLMRALKGTQLELLFVTMMQTGLRVGEALALGVGAVDLDGKPPTIAVVRGIRATRGKGRLSDELKTKGARRTLAIPQDLADRLHDFVMETEPTDLLWTQADGVNPVDRSTVRKELATACAKAKIGQVSPTELRHTAATQMVEAGLPLHRVADVLGHTTTRMLQETYRHAPDVVHGADVLSLR
jgi:integrase